MRGGMLTIGWMKQISSHPVMENAKTYICGHLVPPIFAYTELKTDTKMDEEKNDVCDGRLVG